MTLTTGEYDINMTVKIPSVAVEESSKADLVPQEWLAKLDPEWIHLWNAHGGRHRQAEEVPIEEVRRKPLAYSFTYPTWSGKYGGLLRRVYLLRMYRPSCFQGGRN